MKHIAYILSLYICFLNVLPAMQQLAVISEQHTVMACGENCCIHKHKETNCASKKSKDCCKHGVCNPFISCSLCFAFYIEPIIQLNTFQATKMQIPAYSDKAVSAYLSENWHPPKIAA